MGLLVKYSFQPSHHHSHRSSFYRWCFPAVEEKTVRNELAVIIVAYAGPSRTMPHYSLAQRRLLPHCGRVSSSGQQRMQEMLING